MKDRFNQIIEAKGLTATKFATMIGVHASAISHILNGRSKPGFDVLAKIVQTFPDISLDWLIAGKGNMYGKNNPVLPIVDITTENKTQPDTIPQKEAPISEVREEVAPVYQKSSKMTEAIQLATTEKKLKRILLFFDDGSFEDYVK